MSQQEPADLETDPRFPSGPWTGFFLQKLVPGKHMMDLHLTFQQGAMRGEGRDWVDKFVLRGKYNLEDGKCYWTKRYLGKHDVFYDGFNEGKGIWGTWEISAVQNYGIPMRGGFHIWPVAMGDPTGLHLVEQTNVPPPQEELVEVGS